MRVLGIALALVLVLCLTLAAPVSSEDGYADELPAEGPSLQDLVSMSQSTTEYSVRVSIGALDGESRGKWYVKDRKMRQDLSLAVCSRATVLLGFP